MITLYFRTPTLFVVHFLEQLRILLRMRIHTVIMKTLVLLVYYLCVKIKRDMVSTMKERFAIITTNVGGHKYWA